MSPEDYVRWVQARRWPLSGEKALQEEIATALAACGEQFSREVRLSGDDIIDFMLPGGIGIEVKISGQRRAVYRQCERYCGHEAVRSLVLVTAVSMGFPPEINGKPCYVASLSRGWLL